MSVKYAENRLSTTSCKSMKIYIKNKYTEFKEKYFKKLFHFE